MTESQLADLQWLVLSSTAVVSVFLGVLFHRSHFCTMGAVSDAVIMENFDRLRQWALALAVAIFGFGCMAYAGLLTPFNQSTLPRTCCGSLPCWAACCSAGAWCGLLVVGQRRWSV